MVWSLLRVERFHDSVVRAKIISSDLPPLPKTDSEVMNRFESKHSFWFSGFSSCHEHLEEIKTLGNSQVLGGRSAVQALFGIHVDSKLRQNAKQTGHE